MAMQLRSVFYSPDTGFKPNERYEIAQLFRSARAQGCAQLRWGHREEWPHLRVEDHACIALILEDLEGCSCWDELPASVGPHVTLGEAVTIPDCDHSPVEMSGRLFCVHCGAEG